MLFNVVLKFWNVFKIFLTLDASSSNESFVLQQRLKSLSTELVTLRNRLHVTGSTTGANLPNNGIIAGGSNFSTTQSIGKANVITLRKVAIVLQLTY